jgi:hypothetical protein
MYSREIPEEYRAEVKQIMQKPSMSMLPEMTDLKRLFYLYYRYIKVLHKNEDAKKRMNKDLGCPACKGKVIMYFRNIIHQW